MPNATRSSTKRSSGADTSPGSGSMSACLLAALWFLSACGRLGFELHELDAGRSYVVENTSGVNPRVGSRGPASPVRRDAAAPPPGGGEARAPQQPAQAGGGDAEGSGNGIGVGCSHDDACASGACVSGTCCESRCDQAPACYLASDVSCEAGQCRYSAAPSGTPCDDGNPCTHDDQCSDGVCMGGADCDDGNPCTQDFCGVERCAHASTCQPDDVRCGYAQRLGHGYWVCPGPVSFDAALSECGRIGAKLVTINDAAEQEALWQLGMRDTWIGFRTRAGDPEGADAGFDWVEGQSDFEAWADDDLDAGAAQRCAFLSASEHGSWQSRACGDAFSGFACEIEQYAAPESSCRYGRRGGHGYFSCESERTWNEAEQRCRDSDGYLAEPDTPEEHAYLLTLLKSGAHYAIGVTDARSEGQFVTTRGGRLAFSAWDANEPSALLAEHDYAVLTSSGVWQVVGPAQRGYYLCEQEH